MFGTFQFHPDDQACRKFSSAYEDNSDSMETRSQTMIGR